jgi:hypothetical protein
MAPSYTGVNDVAYVDATTTANIVPATPQSFYALSFLTGAGHGPITVNYVISHADSTTETGSFSAPDWFAGGSAAWVVNGRINVQNAGLQTFGSGNVIGLFAEDVSLADETSPVTGITLSTTGGGNAQVFAVSGISTIVTNLENSITGVVKNPNGSLTLSATGLSGYNYLVQESTNLVAPVWLTIGTNVAASNGTWQYTVSNTTNSATFYRTVLVP